MILRILDSSVEEIKKGRYRMSVVFETVDDDLYGMPENPIGGGPAQTGTVPDRIVHALIQAPQHTLTLTELHQIVEGNPGTVSRQAWTLATNAPDLQIRLRGWVFSPARGRYSLTPKAVSVLGDIH